MLVFIVVTQNRGMADEEGDALEGTGGREGIGEGGRDVKRGDGG